MRTRHLLAALTGTLPLLLACSPGPRYQGNDALLSRLDAQSAREIDSMASDYTGCIERISERTDPFTYPDTGTRIEMVLESCRDPLNRFTVVLEQSLSNACMRQQGSTLAHCDGEAVQAARRETLQLEREARHYLGSQRAPAQRQPL